MEQEPVNYAPEVTESQPEPIETESVISLLDADPITIQSSTDPQPLPPFFLDGGYDLKEKSHQGRLFNAQ